MILALDPETRRAIEEAGRRLAASPAADGPQIERLIDELARLNDEAEAAIAALVARTAEIRAREKEARHV